jgi:3-methyladenine DNA glycosylase/8-oxoguanine DNA glycosylase
VEPGVAVRRRVALSGPLDFVATFGPLLRGRGDPTMRLTRREMWRAVRTPCGSATLRLTLSGSRLEATAWGPGAACALAHVPQLAGCDDDPSVLRPQHPVVRDLSRRLPGLRIGRTDAVYEAMVPTILEQKVTGSQARRAWRGLVRSLGEQAPGPAGLMVPPAPEVLASTPYHVFHPFGVERKRAEVIRAVAARADRLEEATRMPIADAYRRLTAVPGVGAWTAAEVAMRALGDADAVSVGDFHIPSHVSWALAGEPRADDARMLELLEPYRGQRGRVVRLIEAGYPGPPKFGPRNAVQRIESL